MRGEKKAKQRGSLGRQGHLPTPTPSRVWTQALPPWASLLTSLSLTLPICEVGAAAPPPRVGVGTHRDGVGEGGAAHVCAAVSA